MNYEPIVQPELAVSEPRIRVYLDQADQLWRVCGVHVGFGASPAMVADELHRRRAGLGYPTWALAMAAAGRMAAKSRQAVSSGLAMGYVTGRSVR